MVLASGLTMRTEAEWLAWSVRDAEARLQKAVRERNMREQLIQKERLEALERAAKQLMKRFQ